MSRNLHKTNCSTYYIEISIAGEYNYIAGTTVEYAITLPS